MRYAQRYCVFSESTGIIRCKYWYIHIIPYTFIGVFQGIWIRVQIYMYVYISLLWQIATYPNFTSQKYIILSNYGTRNYFFRSIV